MKWIALLAFAAAAALAAVLVIGDDESTDSGGRTIEVVESDEGSMFQEVDNPPRTSPAATPGDAAAIIMPLLDPESEKRTGTLHATCAVTVGNENPDKARVLCQGAVELGDGTLTISGLAGKIPVATYAVTGGTGVYEGARGTYREESGEPVAVIHLVD